MAWAARFAVHCPDAGAWVGPVGAVHGFSFMAASMAAPFTVAAYRSKQAAPSVPYVGDLAFGCWSWIFSFMWFQAAMPCGM